MKKSNDQKLVSIIVPVYQVEDYLLDCLYPLVNQEGIYPYEVILVDDGSKDNSGKICEYFSEKFPSLFKTVHQENQGLPVARNTGLTLASGDWISFVDSDDIPGKNFVLTLIHSVLARRKCDVGVCAYNLISASGKVKKGKSSKCGLLNGINSASLLLNDISVRSFVWTKIFKKSMLDKYDIHFYTSNMYFEDLPFTFASLLVSNEVSFSKNTMYTYRNSREGSITNDEMIGTRMKDHLNSYFACRAFFDSIYGPKKGSEFFKKKINRIRFSLLADVPGTFKKVEDGEGFTEKFFDSMKYVSLLAEEKLPVYGAPWEKNVLDYSKKLENFISFEDKGD